MTETSCGLRYDGFYRGRVLARLTHGICKIFVPGVYNEALLIDPLSLPNAEPASPVFAGGNNGDGAFSYPELNSTVWVFFANGDHNYPVYFAYTLGGEDALSSFNELSNDLYMNAINTPMETIKQKEKTMCNMIKAGSSKIKIINDGTVQIDVYKTDDEERKDAVATAILSNDGSITLSSTVKLDITSPTVTVEADEATVNSKTTTVNGEDTVTVTGNTVNITGTDGDVVVNGVSLVNHTHNYTDTPVGQSTTAVPNK